jgi:hypothetical protein
MKKRGFMPFSAAGIVIVMMVVAMIGHGTWLRHQSSLATIEDIGSAELLTTAVSVQNDMRAAARYAVYRALWEVSKEADRYEDEATRKSAIECLAAGYFAELIAELPSAYHQHDARIELEIQNPSAPSNILPISDWLGLLGTWPIFDLEEEGEGYVLAKVRLPEGTKVRASYWDNTLVLELPCENFDVFIDSRYFLLQEREDRFINGIPRLDGIGSTWWVAEYAVAWSQALCGMVQLSERRTRAFFELAWARHEYDTFGSADYLETSAKLLGLGNDVTSVLNFGSSAAEITPPISAAEVETMTGYIDDCIGSIDRAESELGGISGYIERAVGYARENLENQEVYSFMLDNVRRELNGAIESVGRARAHTQGVSRGFEDLLGYLRGMMGGNELVQQLYRGLTGSNGAYPVLGQQVSVGVAGIDSKLVALEGSLRTCLRQVVDNSASLETLLTTLGREVDACVREVLATSAPQHRVEIEYPGPKNYVYDPGNEPEPTSREIEVYTVDGSNASLGALRAILVNAKSDFERMQGLAEITDEMRERLNDVDIDDALKQKLLSEADFELKLPSRESMYELLPPPPIDAQPGLSVFHDFCISDVSYKRQDPFGWACEEAPPTVIPLQFIGLNLYWAQWEISLGVDGGVVEEVFDFDNPVLPREHSLPLGIGEQVVTVHKPLAYRCEMPGGRFSFTLVIVMPWREFTIAGPEMMVP